MVYKPSEFTPLHGQTLAEIYTEAKVPPGVFNIVNGGGDVEAYLIAYLSIVKVSFTGQVSTGKKVAGSEAGAIKYITIELGGKSPVIILLDSDVDNAVDRTMMANFFSIGQICTNGTRVFVHEDHKAEFETRLLQKISYIRSGDLMDPNTNFGPLVSKFHYDKIIDYIRHNIDVDKAKLLCGDIEKSETIKDLKNGY